MNGNELVTLFKQNSKRVHVIGTLENGVVAGLDLEGRLYAIVNGEVVNRVNPAAIVGITSRSSYINPGGDGLWPAPEGTNLGYEYATGKWRVPPSLTGAKFQVVEQSANRAVIEAEVDLINASGLGIATIFRRDVSVSEASNQMTMKVIESIEYIGDKTLGREQCSLAPWTLCQFDCGPGCEVVFSQTTAADVWDFYDPSENCRTICEGMIHTKTDASQRYQIGIGAAVPWIEFRNPSANLIVRRSALPLEAGLEYIDIADALPSTKASRNATRFSVYSDTSHFMEIEAVGGCPLALESGAVLSVQVTTEYRAISA